MDSLIAVFFFALGSILASFVLVIAERIHTGQSWHRGRSHCNACARELGGADLIPVLSYVISVGKCRGCGSRVPSGYVISELILGTVFFFAYHTLGLTLALIPLLIACVLLMGLIWYDLRHMIIPTGFSVPFILVSFLYSLLAFPDPHTLGTVFLLAGSIGLFFFLFHVLSRGRAMGLGDAPLSVGLSLLAGPLAFSGLVYSFWIGGVVGIFVLSRRAAGTRMGIEVPFAPFLGAGFLLALFTSWDILSIIGLT